MSFSFWEINSFIKKPDVIIIGSGIVGLNAAIALKSSSPSLHVLVVERGILPYGASTRNAGFACFGSVSELLADLRKRSEEDVFTLVKRRWQGLHALRKLLGDDKIGYEPLGGYEIFSATEKENYGECIESLENLNRNIKNQIGIENVFRSADDKIAVFGFENVQHMISNTCEGQVDTGRMMRSLLEYARSCGVEILNGVNVSAIENAGESIRLRIESTGGFNEVIGCRSVIVCVNGFAQRFFPGLDVNPARAQVLITLPVDDLRVKGTFHYDEGFYYFRNVGNRLLLGGGRNLDFEGETTEEMITTTVIQQKLEHILKEIILPRSKYEIEMRWSGIMGIGEDKTPVIKQASKNIFCAVRLGGMGVAIGTVAGQEAAALCLREL